MTPHPRLRPFVPRTARAWRAAVLAIGAGAVAACGRPQFERAPTPESCPGRRAMVVHNDTQRQIEVYNYRGSSVGRTVALVSPGFQSDPILLTAPSATDNLRVRDYETQRQVRGSVRYEFVCLPAS